MAKRKTRSGEGATNGANGSSKKSKTNGSAAIVNDKPKRKQMHLTAFMRPVSLHTGAWRYPGAYADANFNLKHIISFIQKLEAAKFDAFFMVRTFIC
jgi:hypothetical protein